MNTLYTYGYTGGSVEDLKRFAKAGALILDIRYQPFSRWQPQWNRRQLEEALPLHYAHCRDLGNRNYKGDVGPNEGIVIADLLAGLQLLDRLIRESPVVLLCACKDVTTCHRRPVAEKAREFIRGLEVVHLQPGDSLEYQGRFPLAGTVLRYDDPTAPTLEDDEP